MQRRVAVAASGGRDSTALLHATCRAARDLGLEVTALHVHHGLMPQADAWLEHLRRQCERWARAGMPVHLRAHHVEGQPARGDSVEAWARRERYRALTAMAREQGIRLVLLAHHRRDQAETFLLQALRGAGPAGLASMPRETGREGIVWCRPWLDQPRSAIDAYLRRHRIGYVDDDSNRDPRFARSRLRAEVWPTLEQAFPNAEVVLAAAAARAQEAAQCALEVGTADEQTCTGVGGGISLGAWATLSPARRANVLRLWLGEVLVGGVPETLVSRLLAELPIAHPGSSWPTAAAPLRLHRGVLQFAPPAARAPDRPVVVDLSLPGTHRVPQWGGEFIVSLATGHGIPCAWLVSAELRAREGGERFQRAPRTPPRSLKKEFQYRGLSVDDRAGPLVYVQGRLAFVPGLGTDARVLAPSGEPGCTLLWRRTA